MQRDFYMWYLRDFFQLTFTITFSCATLRYTLRYAFCICAFLVSFELLPELRIHVTPSSILHLFYLVLISLSFFFYCLFLCVFFRLVVASTTLKDCSCNGIRDTIIQRQIFLLKILTLSYKTVQRKAQLKIMIITKSIWRFPFDRLSSRDINM